MNKNTINKLKVAGITSLGSLMIGAPMVFAEKGEEEETMGKVVSQMVGLIGTILKYIGFLLLAWGVGMLIMAFKNEDAESKSRSMMLIGVSAALIAAKPFINGILQAVDGENKDLTLE